jgi:hypothetical protein
MLCHTYIACIVVFLGSIITKWLYELTHSDEALVTLQLTVSISDLMKIFLACLPFFGGEGVAQG